MIRREFRLAEGDAYNTALIRRSRQRIMNLGFFNQVDIETSEGSAPDRTVLTVDVSEVPTGELSFGAGVSSAEGVLGEHFRFGSATYSAEDRSSDSGSRCFGEPPGGRPELLPSPTSWIAISPPASTCSAARSTCRTKARSTGRPSGVVTPGRLFRWPNGCGHTVSYTLRNDEVSDVSPLHVAVHSRAGGRDHTTSAIAHRAGVRPAR